VSAREQLFTNGSVDRYRHLLAAGIERVAARVGGTERPFTGISPADLALEIDVVDLDNPLGETAAVLDELDSVYLRDAVYFHHPRYLAHLNCPVVLPALLGESVLTAINSSLDTWDQSAGATLIERRLIGWTADRIGLGPRADGVFTSGGTQSNLQALLLAREEAGTDRELRILASAAGHFSVQKAAKLLGLGADCVRPIATDDGRRMRPAALATELRRAADEGATVMAVVATAGTTDFGSIDPLTDIADLCAAHNAGQGTWFHVDAAYGCGLLVSPTRRHLLAGIDRADSVTVDFHKSFFQPVSSSAVLVRESRVLRHVTYHADYLNPARMAERNIPNQVDKSLQTTRRFDALKLWLTLRVMGPDAIGELFDEVIERAAAAWELLSRDPRFEVATRSDLSTVVFRYVPAHGFEDEANLHARDALSAHGAAVIASTTVDGRHFLKFTLLNPETTIDDIAHVVDLIAEYAGRFADEAAAVRLTRTGS
jgi:L-2,4-diaminobutyrate decarboxylase